MQHQQSEFMSPEKMQLFIAGLSGLAPEESRKAKLLYIRNAISEYHALQNSMAGFGQMQGCLMIIPFFWPVIWAQKKMMASQIQLGKERIQNAIDVWRGDLRGEVFVLDGEEIIA